MSTVTERVAEVKEKVEQACQRAGREMEDITIMAATKGRSVAEIVEAVNAGLSDVGENYVQELLDKKGELDEAGYSDIRWHAIGHLQRNKVRYVVPICDQIHSVDSLRLAQEIDRRAARIGKVQAVLLEINIAGEESKFGIAPEQAPQLAEQIMELEHLQLRGLMTMPPYTDNPEDSRPLFKALRDLAEQLVGRGLPSEAMSELSMGMSGDYEVAIEEGATIIRLGTVLFGPGRY